MRQYLSGLPAWLIQRLSAIYLALFTLAALAWWLVAPPVDYADWRVLFSAPISGLAIAVAFISLLLHGWVGMRDIILDYAGAHPFLRLSLLALLGGTVIVLGAWMVRILVMVMVK